MPARIEEPKLRDALDVLRNAGLRGGELAALLDARATRVRISARVVGGFTLNFINTIFLQPLAHNADDFEFRRWVTLLAHEACHIEQRYWVDSVEQEIRAYQAQCRVADELGIDLGAFRDAFAKLNPDSAQDQQTGQTAMLSMFFGQPAAVVYASLPLSQPRGLRAILPGVREIIAVVRAGTQARK
ncbi:MAG: hypothetical protein HY741_20110 [Chloroflexi bacterium]|nr:hypothetical protein [Chloroflexota bacterium]